MASKGYMAKIGLDLSGVDKSIRQLQNELKTIDKAFNDSGSSALLAGQQYDVLAEAINRTREKLDQLLNAQTAVEIARQAGILTDEEYRAYQREVENTSTALEGLRTELLAVGDGGTSVTDRLKENNDILRDWAHNISEVGTEALKKFLAVLSELAKETVEVGKNFESSMSLVAATMGVDEMSEDYQKLEEAAKQYGATTRYTASQVAEALNYMALAGYDADRSIETLPNLLNLAQAGGLDFARASEMLTNSVMALGLESDEVADYIDKMAVTARSSGTNVEQLGDAILKVGGTARSIVRDGDTTELDTMLGALADNGIKAAEGGTKLRNILIKMAKPTKGTTTLLETLNMSFYDMEGNLRPLPEIFTEINDKMTELNMTQQERDNLLAGAFNARDLAAINALVNTTADRYGELEEKISAANGAAQQMGETMNDNLQGALYQLTSAKEAVEIELYQKLQGPLAEIVNLAADTVRGISSELSDADVGKQFVEAFQTVADTLREEMPQILQLFEDFTTKIVPRLGEVTAKVVELTADKVLPKLIDLIEWCIDHNKVLEDGIKLVIAAMAIDTTASFTDSIAKLAGQMSTLASNSGNVARTLNNGTAAITGQTAAIGSSAGGAIASMNAYIIAIEATVAVALALKTAIDAATEAMKEQAKFQNGFTEESNTDLDRYTKLTSGENKKTAAELEKDLDNDRKRLIQMRSQLTTLENLGKEAEETGNWDAYNTYFKAIGQDEDELKRSIEVLNNLVVQEEKIYKERKQKQEQALNEAAYSRAKGAEMRANAEKAAAKEELAAIQATSDLTEAELEAALEDNEAYWDQKYHWDKKNYTEYWQEKKKFLEENKQDTQTWWEAWNETEAKLGKVNTNTEKAITKNLKDRNTQIKDALTSYKNDLDLAIAQGTMTESEANDKLEEYLNTKLDHSTELYKTEMTKVLETRQKIENNLTKEEETTLKAAVTAQDKAIDKRWKELENLAKEEDWSNEKLYDEKYKVLEKYKKEGELYLDNEEKYNEKLETLHAKITEDNRKALAKQLEEKQKLTKKLFEEAEKVAQKQISEYEKNADKIAGAIDKPTTVTDNKGNERLVFSDYSKKLQELRTYQENLKKLESMELSDTHIKEIFDMDFDTRMKYVAELVRMSSGQREKYLADYEAYQKASGNISSSEARINKDAVKDSIIEGFKDIDTSAYASGEDAWNAYVNGWLAASKNTPLADLFSFSDLTGVSADDILTTKAGTTVWKAKNADGTDKTKKVYNDQGQELVVNIYTDGEKTFVKRINASEQKKINVSAKT